LAYLRLGLTGFGLDDKEHRVLRWAQEL
jgi:hypothetical protein